MDIMEEMQKRITELNLNQYQQGYFEGLLGALDTIQATVFDLLDAFYKGKMLDDIVKEQDK